MEIRRNERKINSEFLKSAFLVYEWLILQLEVLPSLNGVSQKLCALFVSAFENYF